MEPSACLKDARILTFSANCTIIWGQNGSDLEDSDGSENPCVGGSIPPLATKHCKGLAYYLRTSAKACQMAGLCPNFGLGKLMPGLIGERVPHLIAGLVSHPTLKPRGGGAFFLSLPDLSGRIAFPLRRHGASGGSYEATDFELGATWSGVNSNS